MLLTDLMQETYFALMANKARSGLTILGIVIGIGSVIAMVSIGQGTAGSITSSIESLGSNLLMVMPGFQRGVGQQVSTGRGNAQTLTLEDAKAIKGLLKVVDVAPQNFNQAQITAKGTNTNTQINGVTESYATVRSVQVLNGTFITALHNSSKAKVAVLGPTTAEDLFGEGVDPVGQTIRIKGLDFKVIGVTVKKGGSGMSNADDAVYVPLSTAQQYIAGNTRVSTISIQGESQEALEQLEADVTALLMTRHKITDEEKIDFMIMNQADIAASASSIAGTLTILLASIAGISLLVGGIGIMNMMLTTVTERTKEIGLRKAIGAKKKDISVQFLSEAVALTFVGGIAGVALGWLASLAVAKFGGIATTVSIPAVLTAFGVSAAIGIIFGYYPARRAAKLNPIDALRYE
ncbi:MAG TPA: ABC transporter permease [Candidatus Paceibacterota bacterium]|nr:ABC transporter permease [Candidatus Pacearchaeota archaeon]HRZ50436.1 ABC transporter permease [Candidatus Paceibacterota bacterium]HSA36157.1 ABC transporter permease [Candidatus Paceibacterota bacterium]